MAERRRAGEGVDAARAGGPAGRRQAQPDRRAARRHAGRRPVLRGRPARLLPAARSSSASATCWPSIRCGASWSRRSSPTTCVNAMGSTFVSQMQSELGAAPEEVVRAYRIAREVTGALRALGARSTSSGHDARSRGRVGADARRRHARVRRRALVPLAAPRARTCARRSICTARASRSSTGAMRRDARRGVAHRARGVRVGARGPRRARGDRPRACVPARA